MNSSERALKNDDLHKRFLDPEDFSSYFPFFSPACLPAWLVGVQTRDLGELYRPFFVCLEAKESKKNGASFGLLVGMELDLCTTLFLR